MAADLNIHVLEAPCTEADLAIFFESHLGSKWFAYHQTPWDSPERKRAWDNVANSPSIWIGEVSWLKAGLFNDAETYVPDPVGKVSELFEDELMVLTEDLLEKICEAVQVPVQVKASHYSTVGTEKEVRDFLTPHLGKQIFTVSW